MGRSIPHVIAIPYPAQGHLIPVMELVLGLAGGGIKVTVIITEPVHHRIISGGGHISHELIKYAVIPDGLEPWEDRGNVGRLLESLAETLPAEVEALVEKMGREGDEVDCLIIDNAMVWPSELARKLKMKTAAFMMAAPGLLVVDENIPKLIEQGIVDHDGTPLKKQMIHLSPEMPEISSMNFQWAGVGDSNTQRIFFQTNEHNAKSKQTKDWIICNSSFELEPALKLVPKILPIGPLLASNHIGKQAGYFWQEDTSCISWLDQQPLNSTIYVSLGSSTILDVVQFQELALALQNCKRPFLLVARQDLVKDSGSPYPEGFEDRIKNIGKIVKWAPQQKILSHPSVACFVSHCGWNSTIEGVSSGVPFLCWPNYSDQFFNQSYIVDHWEVGLGFEKDECGVFREEEIKKKVEKVLSDKRYKRKALELQAKITASVREGGSSYNNFQSFMEWIKGN